MEYQMTDRLSFKRFLGLKSSDKVPDAKTIWKFRETLDENQQIKKGETSESWKAKPNKLRQKDRDARWTKKNKMSFYGYKNHVKVDKGAKLIRDYMVTDASVHDSQELETLIRKDDEGQCLYADAAYIGQEETIDEGGMTDMVQEKGNRSHKLTELQKISNRAKARYHSRVEHIIGFMTNTMNAMYIRTIGYARATAKIGLANLTYNMMRCAQLNKVIHDAGLG